MIRSGRAAGLPHARRVGCLERVTESGVEIVADLIAELLIEGLQNILELLDLLRSQVGDLHTAGLELGTDVAIHGTGGINLSLAGCLGGILCMFEPMGAGVHGVEAAEVEGKAVLVSGCGPIGLTAVSAAKTFGAKLVIACDLIDEKLETAKAMGADYVFNSGKADLPAEAKKLTDGVGLDAAIDITGAGPALNTALKCLRAAGRLVCVGLPTKPVTFPDMADDLIYREIQLTGVSGRLVWRTWEDFAKVMKGPYYKLDRVIGGRYAMSDYQSALDAIRSGAVGKMLLYPDR